MKLIDRKRFFRNFNGVLARNAARYADVVLSISSRALMKISLFAITLFFIAFSARAETIDTPSFTIRIEAHCAEGNVSCDNVTYVGKSKKTGKSITLRGKTVHTLCKDGATPCRFLGWQSRRGTSEYFVTETGQLRVTQADKVLVDETGKWNREL